jgi:DNA mismatch repair ATPase MutS
VNPGHLLDDASARALDFAWLHDALAPASAYGDRCYSAFAPFRAGEEEAARARAERVAVIAARATAETLDAAREIFRSVPDAGGAIARASMGDTLADASLLELQRFFDACERFDALFARDGTFEPIAAGAVRECARALELGRSGKFGFYLADAFDVQLAAARAALSGSQAEYDAMRGRAAARVAQALGREVSGNEFIVMRDGLRGPLPQGVRVVREAPTYVLCELDADDGTLAALARRDAAAAAVAAAEESVRRELASIVAAHAAALDRAMEMLGEADVLVAAARFAQAHDCCVATISAAPMLAFSSGVFVPLASELEREGRAFTRIDVDLDGVAVLTGPNMGGKSVCLRTCGFIALCAAFGVPVPAASATVSLFDEIAWLGAGSGDEPGGLLSSFAREVVRLRDVLARSNGPLLVLLDEFARTTTPREGRALLVAVLRRLFAIGACGMAATHLDGVAAAAGARHFAVRGLRGIPERPRNADLHAALDSLAASMDYTLEEVADGSRAAADAIALAELLGLDAELTAAARAALASMPPSTGSG